MRPFAVLVTKDLRAALQSGYFIVMGVVTPVVLAVIMNVVFGGATSGQLEIPVGYLDEDRSTTSQALGDVFDAVDDEGLVQLTVLDPGTDVSTALDEHDLRAVVRVPEGFERSTNGAGSAGESTGTDATGLQIIGEDDAPMSVGVVHSIVANFTQELDRQQLTAAAASQLGIATPAPDGEQPVAIAELDGGERLDIAARLAAAMGTMFLLIIALLGVTSLFEERASGTLARLLAAPIPRRAIIAAKVTVSAVVGVAAGLAIVSATSIAIDAGWGPAPGVVALVVTFSLAAVGITLLVTGTARSTNAATNIQASAAVLMAVLGGGLVPLPDDGIVGAVGRITPHYWFLDGLEAMADSAWTAALPAAGAMLAMAAVVGVPGLVLSARRVVP